MEYITVFETFRKNQAILLKTLFDEQGVKYRELKSPVDPVVPKGIRIQVPEDQKDKAIDLLRANGFLGRRLVWTNERMSGSFWIYVFVGMLLAVLAGALVMIYLGG